MCDAGDEDEKWSKEQERKTREEAKTTAEAVQAKKSKAGSDERCVSQAKTEDFEKARKSQQKQTNQSRVTRGLKSLL